MGTLTVAQIPPMFHLFHILSRISQIVFTSSPAGFMPCPFSSMYGATKAFLTEFASSVAAEVRADGVDVTVVHPSPTNSNFYARKDTHALDALAFFKSTATGTLYTMAVLAYARRPKYRDASVWGGPIC